MSSRFTEQNPHGVAARVRWAGIVFCVLAWLPLSALGQATVATVGGGPNQTNVNFNGFSDGATLQNAQFNTPGGVALDFFGSFLYVADTANNAVRRLGLTNDATATFLASQMNPVDVMTDSATNVYVLTRLDGLVRRYDLFANLLGTNNGTALVSPTAMAFDLNGDIYVTELGGALKKITTAGGAVTTIVAAGTFVMPQGVEVLDSGTIIVSDTGNHVLRAVNPTTFAVTLYTGIIGTAGGNDGPVGIARLNSPAHVSKAGNDILVLADRGNHAVRLVDTSGNLSRLYGVLSSSWASDFPGWEDGSAFFAESRQPTGVVVDGAGDVFVSEQFYHLIRKASATGLSGPSGVSGGSGGTVTLNPPSLTISPNSGYFPIGQTITVNSTSTNVYFRTDGMDATTNDTRLAITNGVGTIKWKNSTNDLTALRVSGFVFSGTNEAVTNVAGMAAVTNSIGVPPGLNTNLVGGIGATVVAPVVVNLPAGQQLRRLGFRLEVSPNGAAPIIGDTFDAVSVTTNDFIRLVTSDGTQEGPVTFTATPYTIGTTRGLSINFITTTNFSVSGFAVVAVVGIPVPGGATVGDSYNINVILPSATDAAGNDVLLNSAPTRVLNVQNIPFLVGDSSPAGWYNAGDFGNTPDGTGGGQLLLSDVVNAFNTSVGIRPPYPFTDVFNAMDVFPEDAAGTVGGDGQIRFLDWQIILLRQQHLNTNGFFGVSQTNWSRQWSAGGVLTTGTTNLNTTRSASGLAPPVPGLVWSREVLMTAGSIEHVQPLGVVSIPVHARVTSGANISGMQFRVSVRPTIGAAPLTHQVQFISQYPNERQSIGSLSDVAIAWDIGQIRLAGGTSNLIGNVLFTVPAAATSGHCYTVEIESADGSPNYSVQYEFETRTGCVWINGAAPNPPSLVSDQWRQQFLSGLNSLAGDLDDADGDGFSNLLEYLAGTNPNDINSLLQLRPSTISSSIFELLSAPGKSYALEYLDVLSGNTWQTQSTHSGTGQTIQMQLSNSAGGTRFYRLRIIP
ncbi:MAG: hypothetical protein ACPGVU_17520 [Limisphaerales bacterium]